MVQPLAKSNRDDAEANQIDRVIAGGDSRQQDHDADGDGSSPSGEIKFCKPAVVVCTHVVLPPLRTARTAVIQPRQTIARSGERQRSPPTRPPTPLIRPAPGSKNAWAASPPDGQGALSLPELLPDPLNRRLVICRIARSLLIFMVSPLGLEPRTT
jgi:hypothetical protein